VTLRETLAQRLEIVARIATATSALQKLGQQRAAAEMDVLRCEMAARQEPSGQLAPDLLDARSRVAECDAGVERCEAQIEALETALAGVDREIAADARRE